MFFPKLAFDHLRKNARDEFPFIFATITMMILNLIVGLIQRNLEIQGTHKTAPFLFQFGLVVLDFFSVIFILYTHNFLLTRKTKTYGLYYLLGMSRTDLYKLAFFEKLFGFVISSIIGIIGGIFSAKVMNLLLAKLVDDKDHFDLAVNFKPICYTLILFLCIFIALLIINIIKIKRSTAIKLLKDESIGEKMPKSHWLLTIIGVLSLGIGYYIALTTKDLLAATQLFFIAVILVIIGTYLLFIAGSIVFLKFFKSKEKIFYRPKNFISISQMIFRMKQNGVGLANISILIIMSLVTITMTAGIFFGNDEVMERLYPRDLKVTATFSQPAMEKFITNNAHKSKMNVKNVITYRESINFSAVISKNEIKFDARKFKNPNEFQTFTTVNLMPYDQYRKLGNPNYHLQKNQILTFALGSKSDAILKKMSKSIRKNIKLFKN